MPRGASTASISSDLSPLARSTSAASRSLRKAPSASTLSRGDGQSRRHRMAATGDEQPRFLRGEDRGAEIDAPIERPDPLPIPPSSTAMTIAGRWRRSLSGARRRCRSRRGASPRPATIATGALPHAALASIACRRAPRPRSRAVPRSAG
jgi:hypothetical protein